MKIYDENQFTKKYERGLEDNDNKSFDDEFAKHIMKCMSGPSKRAGDTILKDDEKYDESNNLVILDGHFKTITGNIYKYSGKVTMKEINDEIADCEGNMVVAAFNIHSAVPHKKIEKHNIDVKYVERLIRKYLSKEVGYKRAVKEVKILNYVCETSYGKHVCNGECKLKLHTLMEN